MQLIGHPATLEGCVCQCNYDSACDVYPTVVPCAAPTCTLCLSICTPYIIPACCPPCRPQIKLVMPPHALKEEDPTALSLAHFNTSKDHLYAAGRKKADKATGILVRHSVPANNLTSLPLYPDNAFTNHWHRPRAHWSPMALAAAHSKGHKKGGQAAASGCTVVRFNALTGKMRSSSTKPPVDGLQQTLATYWQLPSTKVFAPEGVEEAPVLMGGRPYGELDVTR